MKTFLLATALTVVALGATTANARTSLSIGINEPVYAAPAPVVYQPYVPPPHLSTCAGLLRSACLLSKLLQWARSPSQL